jgi:hypothetical protein
MRNNGIVTYEHKGKTYSGTWAEDGGMVQVEYVDELGRVHTKPTQIGNSTPSGLARIMLREIVDSHPRA